ncbi:MAG: glycerol-3-phosphate acyltransferase [Spirochaetes bacterium]|nr:glycerol-3-phosphate acyltransferase [Spirochaetota bacterium]MBU1081047.1 glycerol-3-phosphate acyltransferase [Spirochaetota bacterium]
MEIVILLLASAASYLSGSVNYAIIVTKAVTGKDIRKQGNLNPGCSNVLRTVGKGWGVLVGFLDGFKGMAPLILAKLFLYPRDSAIDLGSLYVMGIAAVVGHCRPVFYGFKGGGGIGTMLGVSLFFVPAEFLFSMLAGGLVSIRFFKEAEHKFAQWTPIMFVTLTPFVTMATSAFLDIPLFAHLSIGGHPWSVVAGCLALSVLLLWLNRSFMKKRAKEYDGIKERA